MTRRFAWILNLDAELELSRARPGYVAQTRLLAQLAEHGAGARALLGENDVLVTPGARHAPDYVGRAWCPTPLALEALGRAGLEPEPHPAPSVLRRVNHRLFAHELGAGLPSQRYVETRPALQELLGHSSRRWLLKRPLAFAGRGQLRVSGPLSDKQASWVEASLRRDGLLLEPFVTPTLELSLHGFVWRGGRSELGRPCVQAISARGVFRGVRLAERGELASHELAALLQQGELVAGALAGAGYFGPFGIDAYRYTLDGEQGFCALSEINARYTLGFVTGFPRHPSQLVLD